MTKATNNTLGALVRHRRTHREITRKELARRLDISVGYMGHIETDNHVNVSPRLQDGLNRILGRIPAIYFEKHNAMSRKWYRDNRKRQKQAQT